MKVRTLVVAATLLPLVSACGADVPGVAASVDGTRITDDQVDDLARDLCTLSSAQSGASGQAETKAVRGAALQFLLDDVLARKQAGALSPAEYDRLLSQLEPVRQTLPEDLRDTYDEVARIQASVVLLGKQALQSSAGGVDGADGADGAQISNQQAFDTGHRLVADYAKTADVDIDSRYGKLVDGVLQPADGSLSVPVSDLAVQASAAQPDAEVLGNLPAALKC